MITLEEAAAYFATRLNTDAWGDASMVNRSKAIAQASRIIDNLSFLGTREDSTQEHAFPRTGIGTPTPVKYACAELALALLDGVDPDLEFENLLTSNFSFAEARASYDRRNLPQHIIAGVVSLTAWNFLRPYLRDPQEVTLNRV